jgi:hypothetical protein
LVFRTERTYSRIAEWLIVLGWYLFLNGSEICRCFVQTGSERSSSSRSASQASSSASFMQQRIGRQRLSLLLIFFYFYKKIYFLKHTEGLVCCVLKYKSYNNSAQKSICQRQRRNLCKHFHISST